MPSSVKVGVRPISATSRWYSSGLSPCATASFSSTLGSWGFNRRSLRLGGRPEIDCDAADLKRSPEIGGARSDLLHHLRVGEHREESGSSEDIAQENRNNEVQQHLRHALVARQHEHESLHASGDDVLEAADRDKIGEDHDHLEL